MDRAARELGEAFGNAANILRPQSQIAEIRQAKNEAAQQQQNQEQMSAEADAAGKVAPLLEMMQGGGAPA